ncbi:MAG: SAM-dependent DNA methyltransferase, partial [Nitrosomonadales bacterium]|nr:SAM-dependent DNA methyltransferase [Nitrosomonadales bacterium]
MLDQETKQRIDNLRDTLVGKVPDPKSQVEQIMISMIYKFMNDMDNESTKLGGKRSFFVDDFEKYSWENLFDAKVSGAELVELYSTAVESMEENPNIPTLFRDIFKNAYIPYKDPETLRLFLSQINEFEYSYDSEQLGDAFEHILNTLSSQGDAGQFRTPRHIIDFIVEILDPKKNETILDPASGTSGFLISAYKHIIKTDSEENKDNPLSEAERKTIMKNINGYDISPDMVRIGLANMYLHGFDDPNVFEYDALSSEDRWNEYYDVILANPPFMTPKGGIRPHNKFGLKSNRAEVLFVDYILTHLKPKG